MTGAAGHLRLVEHGGFRWGEAAAGDLLNHSRRARLIELANTSSLRRVRTPVAMTSREGTDVESIEAELVSGLALRTQAPWLTDLYRGPIRMLAQAFAGTTLSVAEDDKIAINLNVQRPGMRSECHVDSNPIGALLYATTQSESEGGGLVIGLDRTARSIEEVERHALVLQPQAGTILVFDAREHPHYVRTLHSGIRVVAVMNYYTADCREADRPSDLTDHLFGQIGEECTGHPDP